MAFLSSDAAEATKNNSIAMQSVVADEDCLLSPKVSTEAEKSSLAKKRRASVDGMRFLRKSVIYAMNLATVGLCLAFAVQLGLVAYQLNVHIADKIDSKLLEVENRLETTENFAKDIHNSQIRQQKNHLNLARAILLNRRDALISRGIAHYVIFSLILFFFFTNLFSVKKTIISVFINTVLLVLVSSYIFLMIQVMQLFGENGRFSLENELLNEFFEIQIQSFIMITTGTKSAEDARKYAIFSILVLEICKIIVLNLLIIANIFYMALIHVRVRNERLRFHNELFNHIKSSNAYQMLTTNDQSDNDYLSSESSTEDEYDCSKTSPGFKFSPEYAQIKPESAESLARDNFLKSNGIRSTEDLPEQRSDRVEKVKYASIGPSADVNDAAGANGEEHVMKYIALDLVDTKHPELEDFNHDELLGVENLVLPTNNAAANDNKNAGGEDRSLGSSRSKTAGGLQVEDENLNRPYENKIKQMNELLER